MRAGCDVDSFRVVKLARDMLLISSFEIWGKYGYILVSIMDV